MFRPLFATAFILALLAADASANYCPRALHRATRLVIVTVPSMGSVKATMHTFQRKSPAASWERRSEPEPAVVGAAGIGWGQTFVSLAKKDEPIKREGDMRTPAGVFRLGPTFGFETQNIAGHVTLLPGKNFCVDDATSPQYGHIVERSKAAKAKSGEDMATLPLLKRGIVVNYPALRGAKAGSCIFVHVWGGDSVGTAGCVALPEARVADLQKWSGTGFTTIAIVSEGAVERFKGCLPLGTATSRHEEPAPPEPNPRRLGKGDGRRAALSR